MDVETFIILSVLTAAAAMIQGASGMGFALILAPIFGLMRPDFLPVTLLILMLPLNVMVFWNERAAIDWRGARWITFGRFWGTFGGLWVLSVLTPGQLGVAVGWLTIAAAVGALAAPPFAPNPGSALAAGLFTGVTETATGIGGPPLALLYQHAHPAVIRATITLCFFLGEIISLAILGLTGMLAWADLGHALALTPAVLVGTRLARFARRRISGARLRYFVLVFAIVSGTALIVRG